VFGCVETALFSALLSPLTSAEIVQAQPYDACNASLLTNGQRMRGRFVLVLRRDCTFTDKVLNVQRFGARGVIIVNSDTADAFAAAGAATNITVPVVMISGPSGGAHYPMDYGLLMDYLWI
jgi:extracellular elastinolytic metalloproteinase